MPTESQWRIPVWKMAGIKPKPNFYILTVRGARIVYILMVLWVWLMMMYIMHLFLHLESKLHPPVAIDEMKWLPFQYVAWGCIRRQDYHHTLHGAWDYTLIDGKDVLAVVVPQFTYSRCQTWFRNQRCTVQITNERGRDDHKGIECSNLGEDCLYKVQ